MFTNFYFVKKTFVISSVDKNYDGVVHSNFKVLEMDVFFRVHLLFDSTTHQPVYRLRILDRKRVGGGGVLTGFRFAVSRILNRFSG